MVCSASSTTMPGATGTLKSTLWPPSLLPRNTLRSASAIKPPLFVFGQHLLQLRRHLWKPLRPQSHGTIVAPDDVVLSAPLRAYLREINPAVCSAAFFPHQSAARDRLRNREH